MLTVVCDGNSITYGVGYGTGPTWPQALADMDPWAIMGGEATFYNFGVNSQTTQDMAADAAAQIDTLYDADNVNILIAWEIRNDVQNGLVGVTPRQAIDHMKAYCLARKAVGWKVIVVNILHSAFTLGGASQEDEDQINGNYDACNTILADEWQDFADGYVDMMADSRLADPYDETAYFDGIHPNGQGRQYAAENINPELIRVYNSINVTVPGGRPSIGIAKETVSFSALGFDQDNIAVIYQVDGQVKSFKPERTINSITGFLQGKGYYIIPKTGLALSNYLYPPL